MINVLCVERACVGLTGVINPNPTHVNALLWAGGGDGKELDNTNGWQKCRNVQRC